MPELEEQLMGGRGGGGGDGGLGTTLFYAARGPFEGSINSIRDFAHEHSFHNGVHIAVHAVDTLIQIPSLAWIPIGTVFGMVKSWGSELRWHEAVNNQLQILTNDNVRRDLGIMAWLLATPAGQKAVEIVSAAVSAGVQAAGH